eukprot:Sspe_Gene.63763::Locus_36908_Transcript_1_1_Confidence_1.000_Length_873::g.63763::m.63763
MYKWTRGGKGEDLAPDHCAPYGRAGGSPTTQYGMAVPAWQQFTLLIPDPVNEDPPECTVDQLRMDDCLEALHSRLPILRDQGRMATPSPPSAPPSVDDEEAAYLAELEAEEAAAAEEEAAFLRELEEEGDDDDTPPSPPESDDEEDDAPRVSEPRSQVICEPFGSVRTIAMRFGTQKAPKEACTGAMG